MSDSREIGTTMAFIGTGNMGFALLQGMVGSGKVSPSNIRAVDLDPENLEKALGLGIVDGGTASAAISASDVVFLCVKPQAMNGLLSEIGDTMAGKLVVSIAAGVTLEHILSRSAATKVTRTMPNLPCSVGEGAIAMSFSSDMTPDDITLVDSICSTCSRTVVVDEQLMDAVTGLSGTGPMYIFLIIEALSDAGVMMGLSRSVASTLSIQTVLGSAKMVRETGTHPIVLKDHVTSPAGTAIHALHTLERTGVRADLMDAIMVATKRSKELGVLFDETNGK